MNKYDVHIKIIGIFFMPAAYYDFFRKIVLQPDGVTLEADSVTDTLTITAGGGVALNPNASTDSFEIDVDYQLYVPIGTTEIRLQDVNSNYTSVNITAGSNIAIQRNSNNEIVITGTVGGTSKAISNASQTNPVVITTSNNHQFTESIAVTITDVGGMIELNGNEYYMDILTSTTFALYDDPELTSPVDGTSFTLYSTGGVATAEYGAPQSLTQLNDVDFVSNPPVNGSYLQYNGSYWGIGTTLSGDFIGSVFADDSTLLVDGVNGSIPYSVLSGAPINVSEFVNDSAYLTTVAFNDVTATPTTLAGYGITDAATSAQGSLADTALQLGDSFDIKGSVFADDSTLLVDSVNGIIPSSVISGVRASQWDSAFSWGNHSLAGYLTSAPSLDQVLTVNNTSTSGIDVGESTISGLTIIGTTLDTTDSSPLTITPSVAFDTEITVSNINPSTDRSIDIGSNTNLFRSVYANSINTGEAGYVNSNYHRIGPDSTYANLLYPLSTSVWSWTGNLDSGNVFHNRQDTYTRWKSTGQLVYNHSSPTGNVDVDFLVSDTHYFFQPSGALTVNFTNIPNGSSRMFNMRIYIAQGITAYIPTSVQVNGAAEPIEWQNGVVPSGTPQNIDFLQFLIWSFGSNNFVVLGQANSYS